MSTGFKLPMQIPGAPERVTFQELINSSIGALRSGVDILLRKAGAYEAEINQATWWRFWLLVVVGSIIVAIAGAIGQAILEARLSAQFGRLYFPGVSSPIIYFILLIPVTAAMYYVAAYASHQFAASRSTQAVSLVQHAYTVAVVLVTSSVITSVVSLVLNLLGLALASLALIVISVYALIVCVDGIQLLYKVERNSAWMIAGVMIVTYIVANFVLVAVVVAIA